MIKAPCKNVCTIDRDNNLCIGCCRKLYEISNWVQFSNKQKKLVLSEIQERIIINNKIKKTFVNFNLHKKI
jgi:predicted Fe-S protein YdhL (DUF1289 family)